MTARSDAVKITNLLRINYNLAWLLVYLFTPLNFVYRINQYRHDESIA